MFKRVCTSFYRSFVPYRNFCSRGENSIFPKTDHRIEPVLELFTKRLRKIVLDRTILQKNRLVVPVTRIRQEDDTLEKLRNSSLCAAVINARDEFEDLDIVLKSRQATLLNKRKDANIMSYYLQVGDELIRCTLESVTRHHVNNWIIQAKFNRYIPGRPNLVYIPLKLIFSKENKYLNKGADIAVKFEGLWFYSYNDEYPAAIDIDPKTANPTRGYRLGELANKLPDGLELHPKYKNQLHSYVIEVKATKDVELEKELKYLEFKKKLQAGETMNVEDMKIEDFSDEEPEDKAEREAAKARREAKKAERREYAKKNPRSLKKQLALMNFKVKEGLFVATDKPKGKGGRQE